MLACLSMHIEAVSTRQTYLNRDLPWMVVRLEKTDRSFSSLGHDWMFNISDNKTKESRWLGFIFNPKMYLMHNRILEWCVKTCYLPDSAEYLEPFGIQRWNVFKIISVGNKNARRETHCSVLWDSPGNGWRLPQNPCDQEVEAALDLGAVDETVNVAWVHGLSLLCTSAFTHCRDEHAPALAVTTERKKITFFVLLNLLGRVHCKVHTASGLLAPPPSCPEDKHSHRNFHPPRNELQGGRKEKHTVPKQWLESLYRRGHLKVTH